MKSLPLFAGVTVLYIMLIDTMSRQVYLCTPSKRGRTLGYIHLILHVPRTTHSFDRPMALATDLGTTFRALSELHRHSTLTNSKLQ